jgi:FO synthase
MDKKELGERLETSAALALVERAGLPALMAEAAACRDRGFGRRVSYSRKVFIPLTQLCRDVCHYCTFAQAPRNLEAPYLSADQVLAIARAGQAAGCKEALFTLGDKPEHRYPAAREALAALGHNSTISYLREMALLVFEETGLFPHLNLGVLSPEEIASLREVSLSMGMMLESASPRLLEKGQCHHGSPDKDPAVRLASIARRAARMFPSPAAS